MMHKRDINDLPPLGHRVLVRAKFRLDGRRRYLVEGEVAMIERTGGFWLRDAEVLDGPERGKGLNHMVAFRDLIWWGLA